MEIFTLLDNLEDLIENSKKVPLSSVPAMAWCMVFLSIILWGRLYVKFNQGY